MPISQKRRFIEQQEELDQRVEEPVYGLMIINDNQIENTLGWERDVEEQIFDQVIQQAYIEREMEKESQSKIIKNKKLQRATKASMPSRKNPRRKPQTEQVMNLVNLTSERSELTFDDTLPFIPEFFHEPDPRMERLNLIRALEKAKQHAIAVALLDEAMADFNEDMEVEADEELDEEHIVFLTKLEKELENNCFEEFIFDATVREKLQLEINKSNKALKNTGMKHKNFC